MKNYKVIILGAQCSGKTTIVRFLRENKDLPLIEEDEAFTKLNNGTYPNDIEYKENTLRPKLEEEIRKSENLIFITSYCNPDLVRDLKLKGFKTIQLVLDRAKLEERNKKRMAEQGCDDATQWMEENLKFHQKMQNEGFVDKIIDTDRPVEEVVEDILNFIG
ncbi:MAG TPA: AAA family ATPase [Candidatus Paceibacterota bacterium]